MATNRIPPDPRGRSTRDWVWQDSTMRPLVARLRRWWSGVDLDRLDRVAEDPQVVDEMRSQASALSSLDEQLDCSVASLAIVDGSVRAGETDARRMAAHVGEVIVRHAPRALESEPD
jgi:hypothetical protein